MWAALVWDFRLSSLLGHLLLSAWLLITLIWGPPAASITWTYFRKQICLSNPLTLLSNSAQMWRFPAFSRSLYPCLSPPPARWPVDLMPRLSFESPSSEWKGRSLAHCVSSFLLRVARRACVESVCRKSAVPVTHFCCAINVSIRSSVPVASE